MFFPSLFISKKNQIRVRMAPSPTGLFHIGSARTALFNFLFARNKKGSFILRIEDTDRERSNKKYEKDILDSLEWLGMTWDEGPKQNGSDKGKFSPYRQSERSKIYRKYIQKLLNEDKAYYCFCSPEELAAQREYQMGIGEAPKYNGKCSSLSRKDIEKNLEEGKSFAIRIRTPHKIIKFKDLIRGKIEFDAAAIGDMIIAKNISTPLYNFACVIDDYEMKISHVIRGEDHISNTPKQIIIAEALEIKTPIYAHIPLILGSDKSKMSKRHGAVSISEYKEQGYLSEALINFMVLMGWNSKTNKEFFSMKELIKDFSLENVQKSGAIFNINKLDFINGIYIRQKDTIELTKLCIPFLIKSSLIRKDEKTKEYYFANDKKISFDTLEKIVSVHRERLKKLSEISEFTNYFFSEELIFEKDLLRWKNMSDTELREILDKIYNMFCGINIWKKDVLDKRLFELAEEIGDRGKVFWPLRVALSGKKASAGPTEIAEILGKEKTQKRIIFAINKI